MNWFLIIDRSMRGEPTVLEAYKSFVIFQHLGYTCGLVPPLQRFLSVNQLLLVVREENLHSLWDQSRIFTVLSPITFSPVLWRRRAKDMDETSIGRAAFKQTLIVLLHFPLHFLLGWVSESLWIAALRSDCYHFMVSQQMDFFFV